MGKILAVFFMAALALCGGCRMTQSELLAAADRGETGALRALGLQSFYGSRGKVDYNVAEEYFAAAAAKGDPASMYYMGMIRELGLGSGNPDAEAARKFFKQAQEAYAAGRERYDGYDDLARGEMLFYGFGAEKDAAGAIVFYRDGVRRGCPAAMIRMGLLYGSGNSGVASDSSRGRYLLESAVRNGFPEAAYELSRLLSEVNPERSQQLLKSAASAGFPAAVMASDTGESSVAAAALQGDPEALYKLWLEDKNSPRSFDLLLAAAVRGHKEALAQLAKYYVVRNDPARAAAVLGSAAAHKSDVPTVEAISEETARLSTPMAALWGADRPLDRLAKLDSTLDFFADGHRAGIAGSRENFRKSLEQSGGAYYGGDWYRIWRDGLPMSWAGDIFRVYIENGGAPSSGFLMNYGIASGLAGQGALQYAAAERLLRDEQLAPYALLLQANALAQLGRADEAYELLQAKYRPLENGGRVAALTFVNAWCPFLRADPDKLAAVMQVEKAAFAAPGKLPEKQAFYDFELKRDVEIAPRVAEPVLTAK